MTKMFDEAEARYPEHKRLSLVVDESQTIGEFLDFGLAEQGLVLAEQSDLARPSRLLPTSKSIPSILARYFEIDQDKIDKEKGQMIDALAKMNERKEP
jgi:hypothetical protein